MKRIIIPVLLASLSCGAPSVKPVIDDTKPYMKIHISFNPGIYKSMAFAKIYPTYAIWAEDKGTGAVHTIYVTGKAAKGKWILADERPSALPVWYGAIKRERLEHLDYTVDSVTSATPSGNTVTHLWQVPEDMRGRRLAIYLEGNISFDYNDFYPKDAKKGSPGYSDVNGQPSLVWLGVVDAGNRDLSLKPSIAGHGHVLGERHDIDRDLSKITTAKDIFTYLDFNYIAGSKRK